jgi:tetratricopeptide (TPR) repeat protein
MEELMKKDYLILVVFLGLTIISGAVIFAVQDTNSKSAVPGLQSLQMTGVDSTEIKGEIAKSESRLKSNPDDYEALVNLGNSYYDLDNPSKAIEYYERSLKIKPENPAVLVDLGAMYRKIGNPDKAFDLFSKAIAINPSLPQAYFNLGMIYHTEKNDPASAVKAWRKYLEYETNPESRKFVESLLKNAESEASR